MASLVLVRKVALCPVVAALMWVPSRYPLSEGELCPLVISIVPGVADVSCKML